MNCIDINLTSIIEFFEEIYEKCAERASSEKTSNAHYRKSYLHIGLQIHIEKKEERGSDTRKEYNKNREKIDIFFHSFLDSEFFKKTL
jgi:hypothetical protein